MKPKIIACLSVCSVVCLLLAGCTSEKGNENNLIQFDVCASYPEKEIQLEDVSVIEYLQLEFNEDFLFSQLPQIITTDKIIIGQPNVGDVLIFSREGKPLSKFNHKGNGPNEYTNLRGLIYDETPNEFFVISNNKIMVYSASGEFKRAIPLLGRFINQIVNFDAETLLLYDDYASYPAPFSFISKNNGDVVATVDLPEDKKVTIVFSQTEGANVYTLAHSSYHIVNYKDGYLLTDFSIDTVFFLSKEKVFSPILIRKPAIQSMDPIIYLNSYLEAGNYEFVSAVTVKKNEENKLPVKYLMRDRKTGSVNRQKITFNDFKGKQINLSPQTIANTQDSKLGLIVLSLIELQEANRENKLSGKLKELVDNSDEYGNDIYMLLHFK